MKFIKNNLNQLSLIHQILIGMVIGACLGLILPTWSWIGILGSLFVGALRAIAPILVFVIVVSALAQHKQGTQTNMKHVVILYLLGTFLAAVAAVVASSVFPVALTLSYDSTVDLHAPEGIVAVFETLLLNAVDNPINALASSNYIGVLTWAVVFGLAFRSTTSQTKELLKTISDATSSVVNSVISLAPFGILGLVFTTVSQSGLGIFSEYGQLLLVLILTMAFVAFVVNPIIAFIMLKENPYPLVWQCVKESGVTAFFTRSSAANIPVNLKLCEKLGLSEDLYSISIPLGATINMAGAAITINVLTLAATHTLGIQVDFLTAVLLSVVAALSACGASGVAGGSLLLIPVACSLFGISNDIAMQVVGVGFIIGVIQDSVETALNSSTDVLFTAVAELSMRKQTLDQSVTVSVE